MRPTRPIRTLLLYAREAQGTTLTYQEGWPKQLRADPRFACLAVNLLDRRSVLAGHVLLRRRRRQLDAVVLLHSVFSNGPNLGGRTFELVRALPSPKVFFIGNEYKLMPEKMVFAENLGIAMLVSQSESPEIHRLYRERLGCEITGIPNTGFDPDRFTPGPPLRERPLDLGYRAYDAPSYLGHRERSRVAEVYEEAAAAHGLRVDLSLAPADRLDEEGWARFLASCRGQLGCEAGGDYFELTDATRRAVLAYESDHPGAAFEDVFARFFAGYPNPVSGRMLSGRVVEAAATKTVQILLEGEYGGYFQADVHYIPLRKDFGNVDETIEKLRDDDVCHRLSDAAFAVACERLTWSKLVDRFHAAVAALL